MENEVQVSRDPLRGNLFENIVIIEALKQRFNRGLRSNLSFYRESNGNEVDLVAETGRERLAVEIKSGATVNPDFFKGFLLLKKQSVPVISSKAASSMAEAKRSKEVTSLFIR